METFLDVTPGGYYWLLVGAAMPRRAPRGKGFLAPNVHGAIVPAALKLIDYLPLLEMGLMRVTYLGGLW